MVREWAEKSGMKSQARGMKGGKVRSYTIGKLGWARW